MRTGKWLIYGANGYTGKLIASEAKQRGLNPILAGRQEQSIKTLAADLDLDYRIFAVDSVDAISAQLQDIELVLHCAGPFSATSGPMMAACLASHTHYLDITGELSVFESGYQQTAQAQAQGVVLCSGVGFDIVPTDCLAAYLHDALPNATHLTLGFKALLTQISPGTAKSVLESLTQLNKVRKNGLIIDAPFAHKSRVIDFGTGPVTAISMPLADVATAYYSTGIPNIEMYVPLPKPMRNLKYIAPLLRPLVSRPSIQNFLKRQIERKITGPSAQDRATDITYVWGEVRNSKGEIKQARIAVGNGYAITIFSSLAITTHLLQVKSIAGGYYTPSQLMGKEFLLQLPKASKLYIY